MKSMNVNDFGNRLLVEDCQKVAVSDLLRDYKAKLKETILKSQFEMLNENVLITTTRTGNGGLRFWFMCPRCKRRAGILLRHPLQNELGCRTCLKLEYKSRRFKGMVEEEITLHKMTNLTYILHSLIQWSNENTKQL